MAGYVPEARTLWKGGQAILDTTRVPFDEASIPLEGLLRRGEAVVEILKVAREQRSDLVVVAGRGSGGAEPAPPGKHRRHGGPGGGLSGAGSQTGDGGQVTGDGGRGPGDGGRGTGDAGTGDGGRGDAESASLPLPLGEGRGEGRPLAPGP